MNFEARNEFDVKYDDRVQKIGEAAVAAIKQIDQFRSGGPVPAEVLDAEVARIAQENLHAHGCDLVVDRTNDGATRFLIKVRSTGRSYDLIRSFFHHDKGLFQKRRAG